MNTRLDERRSPWTPMAEQQPRVGGREALLLRIRDAADELRAAKKAREPGGVAAAKERLHAVVGAARDAGADWTQIGNVLGLRRGNAYQQFRKGPSAS